MCSIEFDNDCSVFREATRTSRLPRKCDVCATAIAVGDKYVSHFAVIDGDPCSEVMCTLCAVDRDVFCKAHHLAWCTPSSLPPLLDGCLDHVVGGDDDEPAQIDEEDRAWLEMRKRIDARRAATWAVPS